ncbi:hypothetical protein Zm00014a_002178 [Zea mays]|jgi:hypothetical protein|uniref:Uncharacterized protein n=2 Tax=Zea mays TaxID=4577 RepID=A0A8J8YDZ8_MAIZE|nr:hypothetical protein ZEAMMB73_Zm00001d040906 [Zea mays]PWZ32705.1 hypothetical protein Zm00014a_002178 [Zea mays]
MPRAVLCLSPSSFRCSLGSCPGPAGRFSPTHLQAQPPVSTYGAPSISILLGRAPYRALSWHPELLRELAGEALVPARLPFSPARRRFSPSSLAVALCSIRYSLSELPMAPGFPYCPSARSASCAQLRAPLYRSVPAKARVVHCAVAPSPRSGRGPGALNTQLPVHP